MSVLDALTFKIDISASDDYCLDFIEAFKIEVLKPKYASIEQIEQINIIFNEVDMFYIDGDAWKMMKRMMALFSIREIRVMRGIVYGAALADERITCDHVSICINEMPSLGSRRFKYVDLLIPTGNPDLAPFRLAIENKLHFDMVNVEYNTDDTINKTCVSEIYTCLVQIAKCFKWTMLERDVNMETIMSSLNDVCDRNNSSLTLKNYFVTFVSNTRTHTVCAHCE